MITYPTEREVRKIIDSKSAFFKGDMVIVPWKVVLYEIYDISIGSYPLPPQELTVATEGLGCEVHKNVISVPDGDGILGGG